MKSFVKEITWLCTDHGWGNGYIVIPESHPLHGLDYSKIHELMPDLEVNGGLTFSDIADDLDWKELPKGCKGWWVVGFDTAHRGDTLEIWSKDAVINETENLKKQLMNYKSQQK